MLANASKTDRCMHILSLGDDFSYRQERNREQVSSMIQWRRSRRCESGSCVEVARIGESYAVRDSKQIGGPVLTFAPAAWDGFVEAVRAGKFDLG
jgi:uncharacterized protein DUF397